MKQVSAYNLIVVETALSIEAETIGGAVRRADQSGIFVLMERSVKMRRPHRVLFFLLRSFQIKRLELALRQENVLQRFVIWIISQHVHHQIDQKHRAH